MIDQVTHPIVVKALAYATEKHKGQFRKMSGLPYITHPIAVAESFIKELLVAPLDKEDVLHLHDTDAIMVAIALLHDVLEDCDVTFGELMTEFGPEIASGVYYLTKVEGQSYTKFIERITDTQNWDLIQVKAYDIKHNLSDLKKGTLRDKYELALFILESHCY